MNVVINGLAALKPRTGVGHYVAHLSEALAAEFPADDFRLYPGAQIASRIMALQKPAGAIGAGGPARRAGLKSKLKSIARRAASAHFAIQSRGASIYHEPNFLPFPSRLPTVLTVHDLSVVRHPEWHPADRVELHRREFTRAVRNAAMVIVVSESVREELLDFTRLDPARVVAIHNGLDPTMRPPSEIDAVRVRATYDLPGGGRGRGATVGRGRRGRRGGCTRGQCD